MRYEEANPKAVVVISGCEVSVEVVRRQCKTLSMTTFYARSSLVPSTAVRVESADFTNHEMVWLSFDASKWE